MLGYFQEERTLRVLAGKPAPEPSEYSSREEIKDKDLFEQIINAYKLWNFLKEKAKRYRM